MQIITCPCGEVYHVDDQYAGRVFRCWRCGRVHTVPGTPAVIASPYARESIPPPDDAVQTDALYTMEPPPQPVPAGLRPDYAYPEPRQLLYAALATIAIVALMALYVWGFALRAAGWQEVRQAGTGSQTAPVDSQGQSPLPSDFALPSGTVLYQAAARGYGVLTIDNPTPYDAVVKLIDASTTRTAAAIFVRYQSSAELGNIAPGAYLVAYGLGWDLDLSTFTFNRAGRYRLYQQQVTYSEEVVGRQIRYRHYSLSLSAGPAAEDGAAEIGAEAFAAFD